MTAPLPPVTLLLGGARSGKSRHGERLVESQDGLCVYLATAEAGDREMAERIRLHRERRGARWHTVEAPLDLADSLAREAGPGRAVLVDCLTLWLSNLMGAGRDIAGAFEQLLGSLAGLGGPVVFISNEVGLGLHPANALGRAFIDHAGRLHQELGAAAQSVIFVAAGLPLVLKQPDSGPLTNNGPRA